MRSEGVIVEFVLVLARRLDGYTTFAITLRT